MCKICLTKGNLTSLIVLIVNGCLVCLMNLVLSHVYKSRPGNYPGINTVNCVVVSCYCRCLVTEPYIMCSSVEIAFHSVLSGAVSKYKIHLHT